MLLSVVAVYVKYVQRGTTICQGVGPFSGVFERKVAVGFIFAFASFVLRGCRCAVVHLFLFIIDEGVCGLEHIRACRAHAARLELQNTVPCRVYLMIHSVCSWSL